LLSFSPQAIHQQGQIDIVITPLLAGLLDGLLLVLKNRLGVVQQATDERAFAVIHAAGRSETQQIDG
jgi:hypothetical protein